MKTAVRYHYIPTKWLRSKELTRPSDHEDMDQLEFFCVAVGNVNWFNHFGKTIWSYLMKLNIFLSCGPTFPVIGIFQREMHTYICPKTVANIDSHFIHKNQKLEITQISMNKRID